MKDEEGDGEEEVKKPDDAMQVDGGARDGGPQRPTTSSTAVDAVLAQWWALLPHSDAGDAQLSRMFQRFDQLRPRMTYPDEVR